MRELFDNGKDIPRGRVRFLRKSLCEFTKRNPAILPYWTGYPDSRRARFDFQLHALRFVSRDVFSQSSVRSEQGR